MSSPEPAQERSVVLLVVLFLGIVAVGGLAGLVFLIWHGAGAEQLLAVSSFAGPATGALAGILATTRTGVPQPVAQVQAEGYQMAVDDLHEIDQPPGVPAAKVEGP